MNPLELKQTLDEHTLHWRNKDLLTVLLGSLIVLSAMAIIWIANLVWNYYKHEKVVKRVPKMPNIPRDRVYRR